MSNLMSTYHLYPNTEIKRGTTPFYRKPNMHFLDYLNLIFYVGGAAFFFMYFIEAFDSFGYIMFIFGLIIFCEIMGV